MRPSTSMDVVTLGAEGTTKRSERTKASRELGSRGWHLASNRSEADGAATSKTARARCSDQVRSRAWI